MVMVVALGVTALFLLTELSAARAQITEVTSTTERWGAIVERSQRSVVLIQTVCRGEPQWGTGFFVSEDRVATNRHVIAPCCGTFPTATALRDLPECRHEYAVWRAGDPLHLRRSDSGGLLASRRGSPRLDEGTAHWSTAAGNLRPGAIDTPESDSEVDQFLSDLAILEVDLSPGSPPPAPLPIRRADAPVSILSEALILGYHDAWLPSQLSSTPTVLPRPTIGRVSSADHASLVVDATFLAGASGAPVLSSDGEVLVIATMSPKRDNSTSHAIRPMRLARLVVGSLK